MNRYFFLLLLFLTSFVYAAKLAEIPDLKQPLDMLVKGDHLFIVDRADFTIKIYTLNPFKQVLSFGSKGEGPAEFKFPPYIRMVAPGYILCTSGETVYWFSKEGKLIKEKKMNHAEGLKMTPVKDNYVGFKILSNWETKVTYKNLNLYDPKFNMIKQVYRVLTDSPMYTREDTGEEEWKMLAHYWDFLCADDKIFIADTRKGFYIEVLDHEGNHLYSIEKKLNPIKVTDKIKEKIMNYYKIAYRQFYEMRKKSAFTFYDQFPGIRQIGIDENTLYVTTYKEIDGNHEIFLLDLKGNTLKQTFLPFKCYKDYKVIGETDLFTISKGILYELYDNDTTEMWELHSIDLSTIK